MCIPNKPISMRLKIWTSTNVCNTLSFSRSCADFPGSNPNNKVPLEPSLWNALIRCSVRLASGAKTRPGSYWLMRRQRAESQIDFNLKFKHSTFPAFSAIKASNKVGHWFICAPSLHLIEVGLLAAAFEALKKAFFVASLCLFLCPVCAASL